MLVNTAKILLDAREKRYAVGAFEVWNLESIQTVIQGAEFFNVPVILQVGPLEAAYAGLEELSFIALELSKRSCVPVSLHLDHGDSFDLVIQAIHNGFTSVMIDASSKPFKENINITKEIVRIAHACKVDVEGEMGRLAGVEGYQDVSEGDSLETDPEEAFTYVKETGIDFLAVAIGTAHGFYRKEPKINIERLKDISRKITCPLVLHGASGLQEDVIRECIKWGISKVNICTEFVSAFGRGISEAYALPERKDNVPSIFDMGKQYALELIKNKIKIFSNGKLDKCM